MPETTYRLPSGCDRKPKIEATARFVARQARVPCEIEVRCPPFADIVHVQVRCPDETKLRRFQRAFGREIVLLRKHRLAGRRR